MNKKVIWTIVVVVVLVIGGIFIFRSDTTEYEAIVLGDDELVITPQTEDDTYTVDSVTLKAPGYITITSSSGETLGTSPLLPAGTHKNVAIKLNKKRYTGGSGRASVIVSVHTDDGDGVFSPETDTVALADDGTPLSTEVPVAEDGPDESEDAMTEDDGTEDGSTPADESGDTAPVPAPADDTTPAEDGTPAPEPVEEEVVDDTTEMSGPQTLIVIYTDEGFEPATVTIKLGDTVEFINKSSGGMWVASAVHPTHEVYPEFDQKTQVGTNGVYDFTFDQAGEWKYHNHVNASDTGTVIVEE